MISDDAYELCLPILQNKSLDDDDKTDQLEELLKKERSLTGKSLESAVLDALWRYRGSSDNSTSPPPTRHTIVRRASPAPWQLARIPTPIGSSPRIAPPPGFGKPPPGFARAISSTASPFTSPRPSPRLAFASPIPHSPSLSAYQVSETSYTPDAYGDFNSDAVEWLFDDAASETSSHPGESLLNGAAAEWVQPTDMNLCDILRSVTSADLSNEELLSALQSNDYDIGVTVAALMGSLSLSNQPTAALAEAERTFIVGKSMSPALRPATPAGQAKSNILCKYWLSNGHCARADCRFSHDPSKTLCKYFISGNCLAGHTCMFSHDAQALLSRIAVEGAATPPAHNVQPNFQVQDYEAFPALQQTPSNSSYQLDPTAVEHVFSSGGSVATPPPPGLNPFPTFIPNSQSRPQSRPSSRHHSRAATPSAPSVNDDEAFPTLGSAASKAAKRHHGKRGGHGHGKENNITQMAEVRMSPSPSPAQLRKGVKSTKSFQSSRENNAVSQAIPTPEHIPWLETGRNANRAYLRARGEAFKHGGLRNKFLQSAAQAWNRNDSRAAKALSLRGQNENDLMRKAHRQAAYHLYEERNGRKKKSKKDKDTKEGDDESEIKEDGEAKDDNESSEGNESNESKDDSEVKDKRAKAPESAPRELFVDLHGLHPEEAVTYLENILLKHQDSSRPLYAITGTGHASKNGKDKVGKAIRGFLNDWRYAFREFSVPGDRNNVGGILGVDPSSYDRGLGERVAVESSDESSDVDFEDGKKDDAAKKEVGVKKDVKIKLLKREDSAADKAIPKGPRKAGFAVSSPGMS